MECINKVAMVKRWPDLNIQELKVYHEEIKLKKLKLDPVYWVNPGRIDPKAYNEYMQNINKAPDTIQTSVMTENISTTGKDPIAQENEYAHF